MTEDRRMQEGALNAIVAQFESASTAAFMRLPRHELDALARKLGIDYPGYMNKPELVEWVKARIADEARG